MKITRAVAASAATIVAAAVVLLPMTSSSAAAMAWVGTQPTVPNGTSCGAPAYNSVQAAITASAAGTTIHVCPGTYVEQVAITKNVTIVGQNSPTIKLPAAPANSTTACDALIPNTVQPNQDAISICGAIKVSITGVTLDASWPAGTCYNSLYGIFIGGGATLTLNTSSIIAAGAQPINGCQGGIGIQVGTTRTTPAEVGHLIANGDSISGYQKNGIYVAGAGSTGQVTSSFVFGAGPTAALAQNGIVVLGGALGTIRTSTISGNECNHPTACGADSLNFSQAGGVLLIGAKVGTTVSGNTISGNDIGVYYSADDAKPAPTAFTAKISNNKFVNNRYEGVVLDQGFANLDSNTYTGGNVGLQAIQYLGQTHGGTSAATREQFNGQSVAAVQVLSDQDPGDVAGKLSISYAHFHGGAVLDNSANYPIIQRGNVANP